MSVVMRDLSCWVSEALSSEYRANTACDVMVFATGRTRAEIMWVKAIIDLLKWAPPVEARLKLYSPNAEALQRGLLVGAMVRLSETETSEEEEWRSTILGHDEDGDPIVDRDAPESAKTGDCSGRRHVWFSDGLTVVHPPLKGNV